MLGLEMRFHQAMLDIYMTAKEECHYNATRFLQMVSETGGLATARVLLTKEVPSDGFTALWDCGRLDLSVEANVLRPEFAALFTKDEKRTATLRLEEIGYKPG